MSSPQNIYKYTHLAHTHIFQEDKKGALWQYFLCTLSLMYQKINFLLCSLVESHKVILNRWYQQQRHSPSCVNVWKIEDVHNIILYLMVIISHRIVMNISSGRIYLWCCCCCCQTKHHSVVHEKMSIKIRPEFLWRYLCVCDYNNKQQISRWCEKIGSQSLFIIKQIFHFIMLHILK